MSRCVLITGVAGFLGRYVARQFVRDDWRVVGLDDVPAENAPPHVSYHRLHLPSDGLVNVLRVEAPTVCIHCAGRASVPLSMEDPASDFAANTVLTFEVLDALRQHAPGCRFLFLSSASVYGNPATLPVSEIADIAPLSPYGFHKRQCELLCEEFAKVYAVPTVSARVFSAYGPGLRRQVIWDMCEKVITTGSLHLRGTGVETRDFIHAGDVARALALLAEHARAEGEVYNVASGRELSVSELAKLVIEALGLPVEASFDGLARAGDPLHWRADISKIATLGFIPAIPLEQGIRGVAAWSSAEMTIA